MVGNIGSFAVQERGIYRRVEEALKIGASGKGTAEEEKQRDRVAEEFASLLFFEVIKAMRATIPSGGLFAEDSLPRDIYTTLADIEVARAMAKREKLGLVGFVERALTAYSPAFVHPLDGIVSSSFGLRASPLGGGEHFHRGVDIAAPAGSPIRAVAAGRVIFSGWTAGYGNLVAIAHQDGVVTRYAHNSVNLVSVGEQVVAGQEIALVGTSGRTTGPHLHFEILKDGHAIDPQPFLTFAHSSLAKKR
jgi:murein DD-endopeptidase MepM/ murein hydrolase activator NlpD